MRQIRGQTKRAAPKRTAKRGARTSPKRTARPKTRGRKFSFARVWERRVEGWRRFFLRHSYLRSYAVLAALTIGAYGVWASGLASRGGDFISAQTHQAVVEAGFTVARITISGHTETSPSEVMNALDVAHGAPIFDLDLGDLRARVESIDWVARATVVRALPGTLHVTIEERQPYALWQNQGVLQVISEDGAVIASAPVGRFSHLRHVVGMGAQVQAAALFSAIDAVPELSPRVRYAVRVSDRRWDLHFDSGVVVQLPERDMEAALGALVAYENDFRLLARAIDTVDLRIDDRIVVRPRSDHPGQRPAFSLPAVETET